MISNEGSNKPLAKPRSGNSLPEYTPLPSGAFSLNGHYPPPIAPLSAPAALSATPTLGVLLLALKRRLPLAVALALLAAVATVAALAVVFPAKYAAQSRLELASRGSRPVLDPNGGEAEVDPAIYRASAMAIIKSPLVLSNALTLATTKGLKLSGESPDSLERAIKVDFNQGPEIMTIKLSGDDPEHLADLLKAIIEAYKDEVENRDNQRKKLLIDQLGKSLAENQKKLEDTRRDLNRAEKDEKILDLQSQQMQFNALTHRISGIDADRRIVRNELSNKKLDLAAKEARLATIDKESVPYQKIQPFIYNSPVMQQYAIKLAKVEEDIAEWSEHPEGEVRDSKLQSLEEKKKAILESAQKTEEKVRPQLEKQFRAELRETLDQELATLKRNIAGLTITEASLTDALEKAQAEFDALNIANRKGGVRVENLRDDVKQIEKTQDTLAGKAALLRAEPAASKRILVLQPAETPTEKDYSRLVKIGSAGGLGAFGLVLFGVAFIEFRSRKINGIEDVTQGLGLTVVGTMPRLPARVQQPANGTVNPRTLRWQSLITESVDAIRTQLLHASRTDAVHVVMVTSASGGEGKTSLASQLAASLARAWRKTLLVDGDLRNPAAHKLFNLPLEPGFSELLRGDANLADVVKPTLLSRLWLLPAGNWDVQAIQALAQDDVRTRFTQMKEQYDFVIVDSCPVLPVADSLLMGQHVDAVIFSVLRDVSRLPSLHAAQQKLQGLGVRMLGVVVIGADNDPGSAVYKHITHAVI